MTRNDNLIFLRIKSFIEEFTKMRIDGTVINCPYWMNKLEKGKVKIRGFSNGKGKASEIRAELTKRLLKEGRFKELKKSSEFIRKLAKRERIGIDCSGFVFQVLDELVREKYRNCRVRSLTEIFPSGIRRTNAKGLTSRNNCLYIKTISQCRLGDLIRMMEGKHVAIIVEVTPSFLSYAHSARTTKKQGVHFGKIKITDKNADLDKQDWIEQTRKGENFGKRHIHLSHGDGIYRLQIFA